jgi:precorrin-6A synthase
MKIFLIGIGTGNINHLTLEAVNTLNEVDLILIPKKTSDTSDLLNLRQDICKKVIKKRQQNIVEFDLPKRNLKIEYNMSVSEWHFEVANTWKKTIDNVQGKKNSIGLLIWGDPTLYDSSIKIALTLINRLNITIISGITSIQALMSAHTINMNEIGKPFFVTTGRLLKQRGLLFDNSRSFVMLDGKCSFQYIDVSKFYIWWGAYLGMNKQIICQGKVSEVCKKIIEIRNKARFQHGWIMDTYLLQKLD